MQIRPIRELTVLDVVHPRARSTATTLTMHIDGVYVYSLSLDGIKNPSSGTNTVGAFRDDKNRSIFAWIDPVSRAFLKTYEIRSLHPVRFLPLALVLLALGAKYLGLLEELPFLAASVISILVIALFFAVKRRNNDDFLEKQLRAALASNFAIPRP
jgi:hypothetical protein